MSLDHVKDIADAVLYEGYILYPYRPSSIKNRQRWTFGGVFPHSFSMQSGSDPWVIQTECLMEGGPEARLSVRLRFLHLVAREVERFDAAEDIWSPVAALDIEGRQVVAGEEAMEREVNPPAMDLASVAAAPLRIAFAFPAGDDREILRDGSGLNVGAILRRSQALQGVLLVSAVETTPGLYRLRVRVENTTALSQDHCETRTLAQRGAFASTHLILGIENGAFVSQTDPPAALAAAARACVNEGLWPVLVGAEGARDTMLAAPIILYDYPRIAPESPGDLFDGTEIDEILTLRILTMTDAEKREACADPRTRALLERTEALTAEDLARLHGVLRSPHANSRPSPVGLSVGARVRLKPKPGGDIMDIVLTGKVAIVEAIERDFDDRVHVAVTIEDDPGRDLGLDRFPGHRFFFALEDVEPITGGERP